MATPRIAEGIHEALMDKAQGEAEPGLVLQQMQRRVDELQQRYQTVQQMVDHLNADGQLRVRVVWITRLGVQEVRPEFTTEGKATLGELDGRLAVACESLSLDIAAAVRDANAAGLVVDWHKWRVSRPAVLLIDDPHPDGKRIEACGDVEETIRANLNIAPDVEPGHDDTQPITGLGEARYQFCRALIDVAAEAGHHRAMLIGKLQGVPNEAWMKDATLQRATQVLRGEVDVFGEPIPYAVSMAFSWAMTTDPQYWRQL